MLGDHPLEAGQGVPQAAGEGGRRQAQDDAVQVVLSGLRGSLGAASGAASEQPQRRTRETPTSRI